MKAADFTKSANNIKTSVVNTIYAILTSMENSNITYGEIDPSTIYLPIVNYEMNGAKIVEIIDVITNKECKLILTDEDDFMYKPNETTTEGLIDVLEAIEDTIIEYITPLMNERRINYNIEHVELTHEDMENFLDLIIKGATFNDAINTILKNIAEIMN